MCTYNGSRFLPEQLESIAAQTRLPDELVVCDDGSSDSTLEILNEFTRSVDFPVRIFRNPTNLGSTKNFEQAIGLCTGDLIALCDQDDIWLPEKLAAQAETMERSPEIGGVFSDAEIVDAASHPLGKRLWDGIGFTKKEQRSLQQGGVIDVLLRRNVVTGATLMFRANLRPLFEPILASWVHDGWIAWMLAMDSKLALLERPLVQYRLHANQQVGVEAYALAQSLTFRQRLERGKREELPRHLAQAQEFRDLLQRMFPRKDAKSTRVRTEISRKIAFLSDRGNPNLQDFARMRILVRNARNYRRYENGLKCLVRDVLMIFV